MDLVDKLKSAVRGSGPKQGNICELFGITQEEYEAEAQKLKEALEDSERTIEIAKKLKLGKRDVKAFCFGMFVLKMNMAVEQREKMKKLESAQRCRPER